MHWSRRCPVAAHNNTRRSVDHTGPLMLALSDYAQETLKAMFHVKLQALQGKEQVAKP